MPAELTLRGKPSSETATSNRGSKHDLYLEPGDPFSCRYNFYQTDVNGVAVPYDISEYTITAKAHSSDFTLEESFTIAVDEEIPGSGFENQVTFSLTVEQTNTIILNPQFTWGMRFTKTASPAVTFTLVTGVIYEKEGSLV